MTNEGEMFSAEEFFGGADNRNRNPSWMSGRHGRKAADRLLADVKVKMIMRIHGVSRAKARGIIARREDELAQESGGVDARMDNDGFFT